MTADGWRRLPWRVRTCESCGRGELVDEEVVLYVVADSLPLDEVKQRIAELPAFMRPAAVAQVTALPRDAAAGKVQRRLLGGEADQVSGSSWDQKNFMLRARSRVRCMRTALSAASGETRSPHAPAAACPSARSASTSSRPRSAP